MFDQILIPTDGSGPALRAAETGVELAATHGASVHAFAAVEPVPLGGFTSGPSPASAEHGEIIEEQETEAQSAIDEIVDLCTDHDVEAVEALTHGKPDTAIIEYVDEHDVDAIVMGTHGRSGTERLLLGSVTEKVVRKSPVPVLTVRVGD